MWRGDAPVDELVRPLPRLQKALAKIAFRRMVGNFDFKEARNLWYAHDIRPVMGDMELFLVDGMRRPFVREPSLVKSFREGKTTEAARVSGNKSAGAIVNNMPVGCYEKGLPA